MLVMNDIRLLVMNDIRLLVINDIRLLVMNDTEKKRNENFRKQNVFGYFLLTGNMKMNLEYTILPFPVVFPVLPSDSKIEVR